MQLLLKNWTLMNLKTGEKVKASVPGDITKDLYDAGKIADPYFALNHHDCYDLCRKNYVYTTEFDLPEKIDFEKENLYVTFKGVDLFADIYLNGVLLGKTDNMFKEFKYDISQTARRKGNLLKVKMYSTITAMENMDCGSYFGVFNTPRVLLRKEQCCFGWDWAANIPGYGIWKDVIVTAEPKERIEEVRYVAGMDKKAILLAEVNYCYRSYFDNDGNWVKVENPHVDELRFTLSGKPGDEFVDAQVKTQAVKGRKHFVTFDMPNAELWWPNGYGEQPLYLYKIELVRDGEVVSTKEGYLAFRSVELAEEALADTLIGYQIRLNGENIFVKGSNWVPVDCFTGAIENDKYVKLITQAKEANYNMLRVWGGGIYEHDVFYETCDRLGIMVWQDFMFACADIPDDNESWLKNTREECAYQIKRLRNHPSIVYWCGGNEKTGTFGSLIKYGDEFDETPLEFDDYATDEFLYSTKIKGDGKTSVTLPIDVDSLEGDGLVYFTLTCLSEEGAFIGGRYNAKTEPNNQPKIAIGICTYKREKFVLSTLERIKKFLESNEEYKDDYRVFVVDNGKTIGDLKDFEFARLIENKKLGGSGGFTSNVMREKKTLYPFSVKASYTSCAITLSIVLSPFSSVSL